MKTLDLPANDSSVPLTNEFYISSKFERELSHQSPLMFSLGLNLEGTPIRWEQLHWMQSILEDQSHEIRIQKASQMAVSTGCIIWGLWLAKTGKIPRGFIYWLPVDGAVSDFVNTKLDPFIDENADALEDPRGKVFNQGLKHLYNVPTFWRGLKSRTAVKSISADAAIYDEYDEAEPAQLVQARQRLAASKVRYVRELSTPTIPDFGINKRFLETDQCHYAFKCEHCGNYNILEDYFPLCFQQQLDGNYIRVCKKCKKPIEVTSGEWASKEPGNKIRGYQISQLYSPFVSPNDIMHDYQTTEFMGHFYNHVIGQPYLAASDRITEQMILDLCDPLSRMPSSSLKSSFMGVDVGTYLHYIILQREPTRLRVVRIGMAQDFTELDKLMVAYNVRDLVCDALPETRKVRELISRNKTKAWMCYYVDKMKGAYAWNEEERIVQVNRTESLDAGTTQVQDKKLIVPQRSTPVEELATHCQNLVRVPEKNKDTGSIHYAYRKLGPDHYRHALNYAMIAASRSKSTEVISIMR